MKISMYLGQSKNWWAYLAIRSNPSLASRIDPRFKRAIFFDDPSLIPSLRADSNKHNQYFYIFWDGLSGGGELEKAKLVLGPHADVTALVVGDVLPSLRETYKIASLYAEGPLSFRAFPHAFDMRTAAILLGARIKTISMPLKNIVQSKGRRWQTIKLLCGTKKVVFCGSYGTVPKVLESLCERYEVDFRLFDKYPFYANDPAPSLESYRTYLRSDGAFLADLYDRSAIGETFFLSAVHLLGREYFIEKIRSAGLDLFANGYATGVNINVYTTPFYRQHLFIDFGSAVGTGNYPRLADLQYFKKQVVAIAINGEFERLIALARAGVLETHFEVQWERKAPELLRLMQ